MSKRRNVACLGLMILISALAAEGQSLPEPIGNTVDQTGGVVSPTVGITVHVCSTSCAYTTASAAVMAYASTGSAMNPHIDLTLIDESGGADIVL